MTHTARHQTLPAWALMVLLLLPGMVAGCPGTNDDDSDGDDDLADDDTSDDDTSDDDIADDDTADDDTGDDDTDEPLGPGTLRNSPVPCYEPSYLFPAAGEEGHLAGARLVPEAWPFQVDVIRYRLEVGVSGDTYCKPNLAHRVEVYIVDGTAQPQDGVLVDQLDIPAIADALGVRTVEEALVPGVDLASGQILFVAVEMAGAHPEVSCLSLCFDDPVSPENGWWSNAAEPPYPWVTIGSLGIDASISVEADGVYH